MSRFRIQCSKCGNDIIIEYLDITREDIRRRDKDRKAEIVEFINLIIDPCRICNTDAYERGVENGKERAKAERAADDN